MIFDERILPKKENLPYQKKGKEPKLNYWGYGKARYFAPKSTYSVKDPVKEFKDLVKSFTPRASKSSWRSFSRMERRNG